MTSRLDWLAGRLLALEPFLVLAAMPLLLVAQPFSWLGLAAMLLPWAGRLWLRRVPVLVPLDAAVALFLAGGIVGLWAAYDPGVAVPRFYGITGAVVLYATIRANNGSVFRRQAIAVLLVLAGVGLSAFFATQYPVSPNSKFPVIAQARGWLARQFPQLPGERPDPSAVASYLVMVMPLAVTMAASSQDRSRAALSGEAEGGIRHPARALWWAAALVILLALVLTESRGGWLAIGVAASLWLLGRWRHGLWVGFAALLAGAGLFVVAVLWGGCGASAPWLETLSGAVLNGTSPVSRLALYRDMVELVRAYPFLGLGLGGMPLVYSVYYLMVGPQLFLQHAHNMFLQVWLEQGIFGAAAVIGMTAALGGPVLVRGWSRGIVGDGGSSFAAVAHLDGITAGALWGCLAILIDGVWNAGLYPGRAVPLMLVLPALAVGPWIQAGGSGPRARRRSLTLAGGLAVAVAVAWWALPPVQSSWLSNLGAVAQGRADLTNGRSPDEAALLREDARRYYSAALAVDENNATARLRLAGMMQDQGAYADSQSHLESAQRLEPCSAATRQLLAAASLALGDAEKAYELWRTLPNARQRLEIQAWRFGQMGDMASARAADRLLARLQRDGF